jgi:protein tyrosine phosphatase
VKDVTTQKIVKGQFANQFNRKNARNEFQTIIDYTDRDQNHKAKLEKLDASICRYKDIYPYKHNVVTINNEHKMVNASWMNILNDKSFIASQAPNDNTLDDFWQMCFQYNVRYILMLCKEFEDNKKKCSNYWDVNVKFKNFVVNNCEKRREDNVIVAKKITVTKLEDKKQRTFEHLQFKEWPDHSTPNIHNYVMIFENLFKFVDDARENNKKNPILVHCSAGIGRTGVFLTLYALCNEIQKQIRSDDGSDLIIFNVFNFVRKLKEMRMYSVENINQYNFIYKFLEQYLKEKNIPPQPQQNLGN